ncbi:MAG: hypothetical protein ACKV2V_06355 [Blastocatellia bacterium]
MSQTGGARRNRQSTGLVMVRCPVCAMSIENVTPDTMVYCRQCRKWLREENPMLAAKPSEIGSHALPLRRIRRVRCH